MPDTIDIPINNTEWTEIQQGVAGLVTNESGNNIRIREAAVKPADTVMRGHVLNPYDSITYGVGGNQKVFARSNDDLSFVVVTEAATP
jgi:hypothetical protein